MITGMELLKNLTSVWIVINKFLLVFEFMLISGSIYSDNSNGAFEKFNRRLDCNLCLCMNSC